MQINIEYDKEINQVFLRNGKRTLTIDRTEIATVEKSLMLWKSHIQKNWEKSLYLTRK